MSVGYRLALWVTIAIIIVGTVAGFIFAGLERRDETNAYLSLAGSVAPILEESLDTCMTSRDYGSMNETLHSLGSVTTVKGISLVGKKGVVRAATDSRVVGKSLVETYPGCHGCHGKGKGLFSRTGNDFGYVHHIRNKPGCQGCHGSEGRYNGVFVIELSRAGIEALTEKKVMLGFFVVFISISTVGILIIALTWNLVQRRIATLISGIRKLKEGNFGARLPLEGDDEITRVAEAVNEMAEAISERDKERDILFRQISGAYETWQNTFDSIDDLISINDRDCTIIRANRAFQEYFGLTPSDLSERKCYELFRGLDQFPGDCDFHAILGERRTVTREFEHEKTRRTFLVSLYPYFYPDTAFEGFILVARDFTELKQTERAFGEQFGFLRTMMDTIPSPVFYKNSDGKYLGCNRAFEEFMGKPKDEIVGKTVYDMGPKEIADRYYAMDRELLANPGKQVYDWKIQRSDRELREVIFNKATFMDASGNVAGLIGIITDITGRKKAEEALSESEAKLRAILEHSLDAIYVGKNGTHYYINPAHVALFGYASAEELLGKPVLDVIAPSERARVEAIMTQRERGGDAPSLYATRGIRKDGSEFDMEVHVSSYTYRDDMYTIAVLRDITVRRRNEEIIRRNYDIQRALNSILEIGLENIPLAAVLEKSLELVLTIPWLSIESRGNIFVVDESGNELIMKASRGLSGCVNGACSLLKFGECLCGRAALQQKVVFSDCVDSRHENCREDALPHGHYCIPILYYDRTIGVLNVYLKEGHRRDAMEEDFLTVVANTLAGIIRRKKVEEERERLMQELDHALSRVLRSQREWMTTFDSITEMIAIIDRDTNIIKANLTFARYFDCTPQEVIGRKCCELMHGTDAAFGNCPHAITLAENRAVTEEIFDPRTRRIFRVSTFPYYSSDGELVGSVHVSRDVTDEKEKEMRLIMSERLASLGQMASGIAHEINNPLAAIGGCTEGLLGRLKQNKLDLPLFESYLNIIQEEVMRCKQITTGMLSFVRRTEHEKAEVDINETVGKTLELIGFQGRLKKVKVVRNLSEALPFVRGNTGEFKQAFLAIVTNALDAMQDTGTLAVTTDVRDGKVYIDIADTGIGIPERYAARIFDPFFTLKSESGGTGLGLSIANRIINGQGGSIDVFSEEGKGTVVSIRVPISR